MAFETDAASIFCQIDVKEAPSSDHILNKFGKEYKYIVIDLGGRIIIFNNFLKSNLKINILIDLQRIKTVFNCYIVRFQKCMILV